MSCSSDASKAHAHIVSPPAQASIVLASVAAGTLLRLPLNALLHGQAPFATLLPSVVICAWLSGWLGGIAATLLSVCAFETVILRHLPVTSVSANVAAVASFVAVALIVTATVHSLEVSRRRAEQTSEILRESEARVATMLRVALDSIITIDSNGLIVEFIPAAEAAFSYTRDEVIGKNLPEPIVPPRFRDAHETAMNRYLETGEGPILGKRREVIAMRKGGDEFPAELYIVAAMQSKGTEFTAYIRDISVRKQYEMDLLHSEERLRLAMEGANVGVWHWNVETDELVFSDTMFALLGRKRTQLHGLVGAIDTMAHLDDIEALKSSFSKALETKSDFELSTRVVWPDGALHWLMSRGRTYNDAEGNVARLEGIAVDVTLVKQAELDALARAERETLINEVEQRWRTMLDGDRIRCVAVEALGRALSLDRCFFSTVSIEDDRIQVGPDYSVAHLTTLAGQYRISGLEIDQNDLFPNGHLLAVSDLRTSDLPAAVVERI